MTNLDTNHQSVKSSIGSTWAQLQGRPGIFENASESFLRDIAAKLQTKLFAANQYIIRQGDEGGCMYFLLSGSAEVLIHEQPVATLVKGGIFGEMALISGEKRTASIRTSEKCLVQRLSKSDFDLMRKKYPEFNRQVEGIANQRALANQR